MLVSNHPFISISQGVIELKSRIVLFITARRPACTCYICAYFVSFTCSVRVQFWTSLMVKESIYLGWSGGGRPRVAVYMLVVLNPIHSVRGEFKLENHMHVMIQFYIF